MTSEQFVESPQCLKRRLAKVSASHSQEVEIEHVGSDHDPLHALPPHFFTLCRRLEEAKSHAVINMSLCRQDERIHSVVCPLCAGAKAARTLLQGRKLAGSILLLYSLYALGQRGDAVITFISRANASRSKDPILVRVSLREGPDPAEAFQGVVERLDEITCSPRICVIRNNVLGD